MIKNVIVSLIFSVTLLTANSADNIEYVHVDVKETAISTGEGVLLDQARALAHEFKQVLGKTLKSAIKDYGLVGSVGICRESAPAIALNLSTRTGAVVSRVSLKNRNALIGSADTWEQNTLKQFQEARVVIQDANKELFLEKSEITHEPTGFYYRYAQALPVKPVCLSCHGTKKEIPHDILKKLTEVYPKDLAVEYHLGDIRGAISIKKLMR